MTYIDDHDKLDMAGYWKLTYGLELGLGGNDGAGHLAPLQPRPAFEVQFRLYPGEPDPHGGPARYEGNYLPGGPTHLSELNDLGALNAETFYAGRGVMVVQLIERAESEGVQYIAVLSGHHQLYVASDPTRVEIFGVWCDVGNHPLGSNSSNRGTFTLVKIAHP